MGVPTVICVKFPAFLGISSKGRPIYTGNMDPVRLDEMQTLLCAMSRIPGAQAHTRIVPCSFSPTSSRPVGVLFTRSKRIKQGRAKDGSASGHSAAILANVQCSVETCHSRLSVNR